MRSLRSQDIMARISVAEPESPIAIFKNHDGTFDARFAGPLLTQLDILRAPDNLVGVYDRHSDKNEILGKLGYTTVARHKRGPKPKASGADFSMLLR